MPPKKDYQKPAGAAPKVKASNPPKGTGSSSKNVSGSKRKMPPGDEIAASARGGDVEEDSSDETPSKKRKLGDVSASNIEMPDVEDDSAKARGNTKRFLERLRLLANGFESESEEVSKKRTDMPTFINIEGNKQKLAAYLGYDKVLCLKRLALSWPVLTAYPIFERLAFNMNKEGALQLIHDDEYVYTNVRNPQERWGQESGDDEQASKSNKNKLMACCLLEFERDLKLMTTLNSEANEVNQNHALLFVGFGQKVNSKLPKKITHVRFNDSSQLKVHFPKLSGIHGEERLESINRCWLLLGYLDLTLSPESQWVKDLSNASISTQVSVNETYIPARLLPPKGIASELKTIQNSQKVQAADALKPIKIDIVWDRIQKLDEMEDLDDALTAAKLKGISVPSNRQVLLCDPRLLDSLGAFKDSIRRQFECDALRIDIGKLYLAYTDHQISMTVHKDLTRDIWVNFKSTFDNPMHEDFVITMTLKAHDDPENDVIFTIYET